MGETENISIWEVKQLRHDRKNKYECLKVGTKNVKTSGRGNVGWQAVADSGARDRKRNNEYTWQLVRCRQTKSTASSCGQQRCADPEIWRPRQSMDFDQRSASADSYNTGPQSVRVRNDCCSKFATFTVTPYQLSSVPSPLYAPWMKLLFIIWSNVTLL